MSGDAYSAAALLAADKTVKIILLIDTKARGQYADKSKLIEKIYAESGVSGQVIKLDISREKADITAIWKTVSANSRKNPLPPPTRRNSHPDDYPTLQKLYGL